jgi:hypothetical protein
MMPSSVMTPSLVCPGVEDGLWHDQVKPLRVGVLKRRLWCHGGCRPNGGVMGILTSIEAWAFTAG